LRRLESDCRHRICGRRLPFCADREHHPSHKGVTYCLSGNTWFKPSYGANGVYYTVVPTP